MALLGSEHLPQGQDLLLSLPQLRLPLLPLALLLLRAQTLHETTTELLLFSSQRRTDTWKSAPITLSVGEVIS